MEELWALLPADRAAALRARLNAEARNCAPGDLRTADQRRADVLCDLADAGSVGDRLPAEHRIRPSVQVTVSLSTLLGLGDQPAELAGYGPIPAFLARRIAADPNGTWRRLLIDAAGQFLDYGRTTYRPPADLARHVIARDRTCCFPGCGQPAARCELDHCLDWAEGGATNPANMNALCARHHHLKHETGWNYTTDADGGTLWTAPTGHEYRRRPGRYPIDETLLFLERYPPPRPKLSRTQLPDGPDPPF
jgi:hypothetical protein